MWDDEPGDEDAKATGEEDANDDLVEDLEVEADEDAGGVTGGAMAGAESDWCKTDGCHTNQATCPAAYCK